MECSACALAMGEAVVVDLAFLGQRLSQVADARHRKGLRYPLAPLLLLMVLAKLAGQDQPSGIATWISHRGAALRVALHLAWARMPCHHTYRRVLGQVVAPDDRDRVVGEHLQSLPGVGQSVLVVLDGKTVRGTIGAEHPHGEHLLAAYLPEEGIVLLQVGVGVKENEISAAPALLNAVDLRGKVVAGDALLTQRALAVQILAAGGDYLWPVKDNHPTLRAEISELFTLDPQTILGGHLPTDRRTARQVTKGHGRRETRRLTASTDLNRYLAWPGLGQVFRLERERVELATGQIERDIVFGVTSLSAGAAPPGRLPALTRAIWGIENGLHWRRDVTFHEDATRATRGHTGRVLATLNNLVIGLLRHAGVTNLAAARRHCDAALTLALGRLLAHSIT